jgi:2-iminobutanoate/2-iminopropanoate deaminase
MNNTTDSAASTIGASVQNVQTGIPILSGVKVHNGVVYVAGKGARGERDIREATRICLDAIERDLVSVGSSMEKALKVTVFLDDLNDFAAMNEAYRGRFGGSPPVRSTVACYGGIPGDSIVEIDCIAAL